MKLIGSSGWHRPIVMGTSTMVSSGHHLASLAGIDILKKGGNAIDAGVAMGLCINVVQPVFTNFGGVAPIMIYSAVEDKVFNISGLGTWPKGASIEAIKERGGELTQDQFTSSVVPSAPDAWITALDICGTMPFSEVAESAIKLAENGFPAHPFFINNLINWKEMLQKYEYTKGVFYPSGKIPRIGDIIIQRDLARTLKRLIDVEKMNSHLGRHEALMAARDEFYMGNIAKELIGYLQEKGGFMTLNDMAEFHVGLEEPVKTTYRDIEVYCCGPWCQGPVNAMALNILEGYDLASLEHNSAEYLHIMISALDLAFADRDKHIGDPRFVDVPMKELASMRYAEARRDLIDLDSAWGKMPPPGDPRNFKAVYSNWKEPRPGASVSDPDTSYGCVVDNEGNAFSATPSDGGRLVPGLGIIISPRGSQSWLDPNHASSVVPGKRPRLTPNPALAFKNGEVFMAYGTPGNDSQPQTMVQVLVNIVDFNMNVQQAIEAPRFRSANFPTSSWPHEYLPGRVNIEARVPQNAIKKLKDMGHDVNVFPNYTFECGGISVVLVDRERGLLMGGADLRRENYAIGY
ncbi:gamma-glutamyltransferase family protein [Thermoproteota archaeon]